MPLVAPLSIDGDEEVARLAEFFDETLGYCPNSVLTMMRRPPIARACIEFNKAVMENKGRVTSALKRLVGFVSSKAAGCSYCQAHTIRAAERYGAEAEKLENVWEYRTHPAFTEAERVALDFALAASTIPNAVDADLQNRLRQHWDDGEIVELSSGQKLFSFIVINILGAIRRDSLILIDECQNLTFELLEQIRLL